jgi:hypothetical protein
VLSKYIKSCRIVCFNDEDKRRTVVEVASTPFELRGEWKVSDSDAVPTLLVGWSSVKSLYPNQNILVHKIDNNISWAYSMVEDSELFPKQISEFIKTSSESFLTIPYESYDAIIDGDFKEFCTKFIMKSKGVFVYFSETAMYVFDGFSEFGINLESLKYCNLPVKELIGWFVEEFRCTVLNRSNIKNYTKSDYLKRYISVENALWVKTSETLSESEMLKMFGNNDCSRHLPFFMSLLPISDLSEDEIKSCLRHCTKDAVSEWLSEQRIYFDENFTHDRLKLTVDGSKKYAILGYSAKTTLTGRINCIEGTFNPQNLPKDSEQRKHIVSRFDGGNIVVFDYVSFETKIATYMSGNQEFIEKYKDSDMHAEVAKDVLGWDGIAEGIRNIAKNANHTLLYGGGETTVEALLIGIKNPKKAVEDIKKFLSPLLEKSAELSAVYDELGYVVNPFGTLVRPTKRWATFNNYVQSTAADIVTEKIIEISSLVTSIKSKFIFQVHDSFVFDIHPDEINMIPEIVKVLSIHNGISFNVETKIGKNLLECTDFKSVVKKLQV